MSSTHDRRRREVAAGKLRLALDMFGLGESLMRQKLRREQPETDREEIEARIAEWLQTRPGAELGDAAGKPVPVPE